MSEKDDDMQFLIFQRNSDSLDILSSEGSDADFHSGKYVLDTSSFSFPDSHEEDGDMTDIVDDLNLLSFGKSSDARQLVARILGDHVLIKPNLELFQRMNEDQNNVSNRGHSALRTLGLELKETREENRDLRVEIDRLKSLISTLKDDLVDLVSHILLIFQL